MGEAASQRLYALFEEASGLDGVGQQRLLERVARETPELRGPLELLLRHDEQGSGKLPEDPTRDRSVLAHMQAAALEPEHDAQLDALATFASPTGRYELVEPIGRGGMGVVLRVWDRNLQRHQAMKVVWSGEALSGARPAPVDQSSLGRFVNEALVTARLDHPGIVSVTELGRDGEGRAYFTMKLVQGQELGDVFALVDAGREGWTVTRALGLMLKVCEALAYAHAKGVVHRDLKPSNVMIGRFGEVYVMDWGIARILEAKDRPRPAAEDEAPAKGPGTKELSREGVAQTLDGMILGTPQYMSPEQAFGRVEALGPQTDVYAAGAMLYRLLTGRAPYTEPGRTIPGHALLAQLVHGPPTAVETLAPRSPPELISICEKAMQRDPAQRYPSMQGLAEDLRAFLEGRVVHAYEAGAWAEAKKWVRRNRPLAAALAAAVLLLLGGLVTALLLRQQAMTERRRADREAEEANARADDVLRLSALQELDDLVAEADRLWPAHPEMLERYDLWLAKASQLLARRPDHERKLAELRAKATPWTEAAQARYRAENPRVAELRRIEQQRAHEQRMHQAAQGNEPPPEPTAAEVGVDLTALPPSPGAVNDLAWPLIDPGREDWGGEAEGLVLARHALGLAAGLAPAERAGIRDSLAWALFANGRFDEAVFEAERALEEADADRKRDFQAHLERLTGALEDRLDPERAGEHRRRLEELDRRVAALEAELGQPPAWIFEEARDRWWHNQLVKLVDGLRALADPGTGLASAGISPEHGWGVRKRAEFVRTLAERSLSGPEARARWDTALASIADPRECPRYGGLRLAPQLGLLPLGRDPASGLWEFAHLQSGAPPEREADGTLRLTEETGLVLVLLPGGPFWMGGQAEAAEGRNHDPLAKDVDGPVREVTLSPFFLSKYEMTQGQWAHFTGGNPSAYDPSLSWGGQGTTLVHPVEQVNWFQCQTVTERLGLSLPSDAQWEYGARGGTGTVWWTGDELDSLDGAANLADQAALRGGMDWPDLRDGPELDDGYVVHAPVSAFRANPFGLHNVHGNVFEWCLDGDSGWIDDDTPVRDPLTPPANTDARLYRGGSFDFGAWAARSSLRVAAAPLLSGGHIGLRPARALMPEAAAAAR